MHHMLIDEYPYREWNMRDLGSIQHIQSDGSHVGAPIAMAAAHGREVLFKFPKMIRKRTFTRNNFEGLRGLGLNVYVQPAYETHADVDSFTIVKRIDFLGECEACIERKREEEAIGGETNNDNNQSTAIKSNVERKTRASKATNKAEEALVCVCDNHCLVGFQMTISGSVNGKPAHAPHALSLSNFISNVKNVMPTVGSEFFFLIITDKATASKYKGQKVLNIDGTICDARNLPKFIHGMSEYVIGVAPAIKDLVTFQGVNMIGTAEADGSSSSSTSTRSDS
jgi:hypothetical protein